MEFLESKLQKAKESRKGAIREKTGYCMHTEDSTIQGNTFPINVIEEKTKRSHKMI